MSINVSMTTVGLGENNTVSVSHCLNGKPLSTVAYTKDECLHHIGILQRHADALPENVPTVKQ